VINLAGSAKTLEELAKNIAESERKIAPEMKTVAANTETNSEPVKNVATKVERS
jgi:hypothetical protein